MSGWLLNTALKPGCFSPRPLRQQETEVCRRLWRRGRGACPQTCPRGAGAYLQTGLLRVAPSQAARLERGGVRAPSPRRGTGSALCPLVYQDGSWAAPALHLCYRARPQACQCGEAGGPGFQVRPVGGSAPRVCCYLGNPALPVHQAGSAVGSRADRYTGGACLEHQQRDGAFLELRQLQPLHNLCFQHEHLPAFSETERMLAVRTRLTLGLACALRFSEEEEG